MGVLTDQDLLRMLKDGKNIIEIASGTVITPSAKERINAKGIEVIFEKALSQPANITAKPWEKAVVTSADDDTTLRKYVSADNGGYFDQKPEHMTAIRGNQLVLKNHPRIIFRGKVDSFIAELLMLMSDAEAEGRAGLVKDLDSIKEWLYHLQLCEVGEKPLEELKLLGLTDPMLKEQSHNPKKFFGVEHLFQMDYTAPREVVRVNVMRTRSRELELSAFDAFFDGKNYTREDISAALNRLSSAFYIIELKLMAGLY